jgi:hypothetical protein
MHPFGEGRIPCPKLYELAKHTSDNGQKHLTAVICSLGLEDGTYHVDPYESCTQKLHQGLSEPAGTVRGRLYGDKIGWDVS